MQLYNTKGPEKPEVPRHIIIEITNVQQHSNQETLTHSNVHILANILATSSCPCSTTDGTLLSVWCITDIPQDPLCHCPPAKCTADMEAFNSQLLIESNDGS